MKVLQVITPSKIAGAERSTTSLCEHLQRAGHEVMVACKAGSPLIEAMRAAEIDVRPAPIAGKLNPGAAVWLARLARNSGSQVIHTQLSTAALHGSIAARMAGLPAVAHVRALNTATMYRLAHRVIAISHAVKQHLVAQGMNPDRIDVVYSGADPDRYFLPCTRGEAKRRLGIPETAPLVGVVAHLTAKKGHSVFLEAFTPVARKHPDLHALFLGDGPERDALRAQVEQLGLRERVIFSGFQSDVLPYYAAVDVVVLPSTGGEGLPRALLEAGLLGRAAIGTRISGVPEIIQDGETGFVVPVGDAGALAELLLILVEDGALRARLGAAAREWVAATFTVEAMVAGTVASYERAGAR